MVIRTLEVRSGGTEMLLMTPDEKMLPETIEELNIILVLVEIPVLDTPIPCDDIPYVGLSLTAEEGKIMLVVATDKKVSLNEVKYH